MDTLMIGSPDAGKPHLGLMCGNMTPPLPGRPALLTHGEVETISTNSATSFITA